jgi:hypothetical protein
MAVVANTFQSTSAVGNREELSNVVDRIDPEETPLYSMMGKASFKTTHPEWETDSLDAPGDNAQLEGDDYSFSAINPAVRVGNYTQIFRKSGIVSGSQDAGDNAGSVEQIRYQKAKKGVEMRRDVEFSLLAANASVGGTTRKSASVSTWIESNVSRGAGGANGGFNQGTGLTVAPTDGTQRAFTKTLMDDVMQQGAINGARFKHVMGSHYIKSVFATFMSDTNVAAFRYAAGKGEGNTLVATADVYLGPHGKVMFHDNVVQSGSAAMARNVHFCDPEYTKFGWYRKIKEDKKVAKTGDANRFVLIGEGASRVSNEKGLGVVADVFGIDATT